MTFSPCNENGEKIVEARTNSKFLLPPVKRVSRVVFAEGIGTYSQSEKKSLKAIEVFAVHPAERNYTEFLFRGLWW